MITQQMSQVLELYNKGLALYKESRFSEALSYFQKAIAIKSDDGPSLMYEKRCKDYIENPPPVDWDGVYVMKTK